MPTSTTQQNVVNNTASMLSSSSDHSGCERQWKICDKSIGEELAREQECYVLNCSTQEGTPNPPSRNLYAAAWFTWSSLSNTFCWLPLQSYVCSWNSKVILETQHMSKCKCLHRFWCQLVLAISMFKLDDCNQKHFCNLNNLMSIYNYLIEKMRTSTQSLE